MAGELDEAASRFAGGVAHDFSNFLAVISGFAQLLRKQHQDNAELAETLGEILEASNRAAHMVDRLGLMAGQRTLDPKPMDLAALLRQAQERLQQLLGEGIQLELQAPAAGLTALVDVARLEDAVTAVCEHIKADLAGTGRITITAAADAANGHVRLSVRDTGQGLEPAMAARAFEPFFLKATLKRGTGLGLPFAHAVARLHGGELTIDSAPGQGTTFHLLLPSAKIPA